jgi:two-component system response regulator GlrR
MNSVKLLLLDLNPEIELGNNLRQTLASSARLEVAYQHLTLDNGEALLYTTVFLNDLERSNPDLIFLIFPATLFQQACLLIRNLKEKKASIPVVVVQDENDPEDVIELLKMGISDYIIPPLKIADIYPRIWRLVNPMLEETSLTQTLKEKCGLNQLIGESGAFMAEIKKIPRVAKCDASVLILGETGTGKELCARAIHYLSPRMHKPFLPVNCGAIPLELIENELFGHERGAYTGAATTKSGLVSEADGGTLFLDEIDCLPLLAQVKILRFLQDKVYRSLGSTRKCAANVRIVAATNVDLQGAVREGRFRQDLFYRLNVVSLLLPPLREREGDMLLLARHFLVKYAVRFNKPVMSLSPDAGQKLMSYHWPGNVRELEHMIERAVVFSDRSIIQASDLHLPGVEPVQPNDSFQAAKSRMIEQFEKAYIHELLNAHHGNITRAAQAAQKNRRAFWQLIRKHHVDMANFKLVGK